MDDSDKEIYTYHDNEQIPYNEQEEIVEGGDFENVVFQDIDDEIIDEEIYDEEEEYYMEEEMPVEPPRSQTQKFSVTGRKYLRMEKVTEAVSAERIDVIDVGKSIILGTSDKSLNRPSIEKAVANGVASAPYLGTIGMEELVHGLMAPSGADGRFAVLGTSTMWNALKSNIRDLRNAIQDNPIVKLSEPTFDSIDLRIENLPLNKQYPIQNVGVFTNANLLYIFRQLRFRKNAKLLNKTKQFLKAYFIISCRPRCMIWRYTLRRSGNSSKKAILNLPQCILNQTIDFLLDLTGIGDGTRRFEALNPESPFYRALGEDPVVKRNRYDECCKLKDSLIDYFRDTITDVLNEIREMPFCLNTGNLSSALRGRRKGLSLVLWKTYEIILKKEHDMPTEANTSIRTKFEQQLCAALPRNNIDQVVRVYPND